MNFLTKPIRSGLCPLLLLIATSPIHAAEPDPRTAPLAKENPLYLKVGAPLDDRVADLVSRLSLEEKALVLNHNGPDLERIGLRGDKWNQCLNGVQWNRPTTLFPVCVAMAATWNPELIQHEVARVLSDEARAIYNGWRADPGISKSHKGLIYRGPVINIERNPYWGRNHEAWGEDPYLTGRMGVAYVKGLQGDDPDHLKIAATLKHYAVNNVEVDRLKLDASVSERMLHEYWLPHFRDAVVEGGACSLMASYNAINGTPNNINRWLLTEVLKEQWKHDGFVVSDLGGVKTMVEGHEANQMDYVDAVAKSLMAGCDFSDKEYQENIPAAVRAGKLTQERLDDAVTRVLRVRFRLGEFDPLDASPYHKISPDVIQSAEHRAIALKTARQAIVLLQNRDRLLPLDSTKPAKIAVIGPLADRVVRNNYNGSHTGLVGALAGIRDRVGKEVEVLHASGGNVKGRYNTPATRVDREDGFSGGASVKLESSAVGEFIQFDFTVPEETAGRLALRFKSYGNRGVFQASLDGRDLGEPIDMRGPEDGYGKVAELGTVKLAQGRHEIRFTVSGKDARSGGFTGHFDRLDLTSDDVLKLELEKQKYSSGRSDDVKDPIAEAAELAARADVAIVCVGTDESIEQEGRDRKSLGLPGKQEELVMTVLAANPRTIVVLKSAGPLTVPSLKEKAPAILQAWWAGEEGGNALADVIFGKVNPSGRLPHTVYASEKQVPPLDEYDISKGFTYMYVKGDPLYAFGHGLSYTTFDYSDLRISASDKIVEIHVDVKNSGDRDGDEVVQLYTRAVKPSVVRPNKELRGFQRISLAAGETKNVTLSVPVEKLAYYDETQHAFVVEPGDYDFLVGSASDDIRSRVTHTVRSGSN